MAQVTTFFNGQNVIAGPALVLTSSRDVALTQVAALTVPAPAAGTFTISTADAAKLNSGDLLCLASVTPNTFLAAEAKTLSMITSIIAGTAGWNVTVSPAIGTPPTTPAGITRVWANRGATDGGIEFMAKKTINPLMVDQSVVAVGSVDKDLAVGIKAPLAEATLSNFALAAGAKDPVTGTVLQINSTDPSRTDRLLVIGKAPSGLNRWFIIHKAKFQGTATQKNDKSNKPIFMLDAIALVDSTMNPDTLDCLDA